MKTFFRGGSPLHMSFVVVAVLAAAPYAQRASITIDRAAWLQGCWEVSSPNRTVEEQWMAPRAGSMLGMGRTVVQGRLTEYESVLIREESGALVYEAHPSGQPTATFHSAEVSESTLVFQNPQHDFPQRVGYRRDGPDALLAWIDGIVNGEQRRVEFAYKRVSCDR